MTALKTESLAKHTLRSAVQEIKHDYINNAVIQAVQNYFVRSHLFATRGSISCILLAASDAVIGETLGCRIRHACVVVTVPSCNGNSLVC